MSHLSKIPSNRISSRIGGVDTSNEEDMMPPPTRRMHTTTVNAYHNNQGSAGKHDYSVSTDGESDDEASISDVKDLFHKARLLLCPTEFYRQITYLYAERKLMVFFLVHFVSTMIIWCKQNLQSGSSNHQSCRWIFLTKHFHRSPLCTSQTRPTAHKCTGSCQPLLVEDSRASFGIWFHACHSLSNVVDSTDHGSIFDCKSMRLFLEQYPPTE